MSRTTAPRPKSSIFSSEHIKEDFRGAMDSTEQYRIRIIFQNIMVQIQRVTPGLRSCRICNFRVNPSNLMGNTTWATPRNRQTCPANATWLCCLVDLALTTLAASLLGSLVSALERHSTIARYAQQTRTRSSATRQTPKNIPRALASPTQKDPQELLCSGLLGLPPLLRSGAFSVVRP